MWDQSCPECNRLWRLYAFATNANIKLNGQVKMAALTHDAGLLEQLAPVSESATQERESHLECMRHIRAQELSRRRRTAELSIGMAR